jgi:hypothetical protein
MGGIGSKIKKWRGDYGCAEDEMVEADVSLNYGECDLIWRRKR